MKFKDRKVSIFVYGSLRKGLYNHRLLLDERVESKGTAKLRNFEMYSLGDYPMIVKGKGEILVEKYLVPMDIFMKLIEMELYAGYHMIERFGCYMFVFPKKQDNLIKVEHGDWKKFVEDRKNEKIKT